ncbi:MAG: DNA repair protein RecO [Polyangiaceae bacterium]
MSAGAGGGSGARGSGGSGASGAGASGARGSGASGGSGGSGARSRRTPGPRVATDALLLRKVAYGEADAVVTLFTEARGVVPAIARAARKSSKRFGALEPLHLLRVTFEDKPGAELCLLTEAQLAAPRMGVLGSLASIEVASVALSWVRRASPQRVAEPALWRDVNELLDALDAGPSPEAAKAQLASMGLRLLQGAGWGLQLDWCVRCGRECAPEATACIDGAQGGLVCRACGGARLVLRPARRRALRAALEGDTATLADEDAACAIELVTATLEAHAAS